MKNENYDSTLSNPPDEQPTNHPPRPSGEMTDERMRVVIAEACGWRFVRATNAGVRGCPPASLAAYKMRRKVPNYTASLDAMAQAEATLTLSQETPYKFQLLFLTADIHLATARQRATAFIATLKL